MSSVVYVRFRAKVTMNNGGNVGYAALNNANGGNYGDADTCLEFAKSDVFPIQQACNSLTLTLNGTSTNYRPNEILRDLVISQVHKDAIGKLGQPVFDFSDHGFGVKRVAGGGAGTKLQDPGLAYGMTEMQQ